MESVSVNQVLGSVASAVAAGTAAAMITSLMTSSWTLVELIALIFLLGVVGALLLGLVLSVKAGIPTALLRNRDDRSDCWLAAFCLVTLFLYSMYLLFSCYPDLDRLCFLVYTMSMCCFHFMEFISTAKFHPETLSFSSFLLNHSRAYHIAFFASFAEFWVELVFFPEMKRISLIFALGLVMVLFGQAIRTSAMWYAKKNFTHLVATRKKATHQLITTGIYSFSRHPGYMGWFYWSIGTQVLLCNPVCLIGYTIASLQFFADRIAYEEAMLLDFFGDQYRAYQGHVPIRIIGLDFYKQSRW